MLTKIMLLFRWEAAQSLRALPWQRIATIAILFAALLLALRAGDFMVWQLTKGIMLACILNFSRLIHQTDIN